MGRRPGVWGELRTLGLCGLDASHPTPELRCRDRVTSPSVPRASREFWLTWGSCPPLHPAGQLVPVSLAGGPTSPSRPVVRTCPGRTLSPGLLPPVCGVLVASVFLGEAKTVVCAEASLVQPPPEDTQGWTPQTRLCLGLWPLRGTRAS